MTTSLYRSTPCEARGRDVPARHRDALNVDVVLRLAQQRINQMRNAEGYGQDVDAMLQCCAAVRTLVLDLGLDVEDVDYDPDVPYVRSTDASELRRLERRVDALEAALASLLSFSPTSRTITDALRAARANAEALLEDR